MRCLAIGTCLACVAFSTPIFMFYSYSKAVKSLFNMTQSQEGWMASAALISGFSTFPAGLVLDNFGLLVASLAAIMVSTIGWVMLWVCSVIPHVFTHLVPLIVAATIVAGHGRTYSYSIGLSYSVAIVPTKWRPVMVAAYELFYDIGIMGYLIINYYIFIGVTEFFLFVVIALFIVNSTVAIVLLFPRKTSNDCDTNDDTVKLDTLNTISDVMQNSGNSDYEKMKCNFNKHKGMKSTGSDQQANKSVSENSSKKPQPPTETTNLQTNATDNIYSGGIFSLRYQLIMWSNASVLAITSFNIFNVAFFTESVYLDNLSFLLIIVNRGSVILARLVIFGGTIVTTITFLPEIVLCNNSIILITQCLLYLYSDNTLVLYFSYAITGMIEGCLFTIGPVLIQDYFGMDNYATKVGLMFSMVGGVFLVFQMCYSMMYEGGVLPGGGQICYGTGCMRGSVLVTAGVGVVSSVCSGILVLLKYRQTK